MYSISLIISIIISLTGANFSTISIKSKKIVGGRNPKFGEGRYVVQVQTGEAWCGGSIISETHILSAAHCIEGDETTGKLLKPIRVHAHSNVVFVSEASVIQRNVARVFQPSVYTNDFINDIAILELKESLGIVENNLQKLTFPEPLPDGTYETYENALILFAGYGNTNVDMYTMEDGKTGFLRWGDGELQVANAIVNDAETCQKFFKHFQSDQLCLSVIEDESQQRPQGTCTGDSGSPAVYNDDVVIGVLSVGITSCNNNLVPSLFTRISSFIHFIKGAMNGETDAGLIAFDA